MIHVASCCCCCSHVIIHMSNVIVSVNKIPHITLQHVQGTIDVLVPPVSCPFVIHPISIIYTALGVVVHTFSMPLAALPLSLIFRCVAETCALAVPFVVLPFAFISVGVVLTNDYTPVTIQST